MRSLVDFNGLTSGDIFARLFGWFFWPSFAALFAAGLGLRSEAWNPALVGELGVGLIVWSDATRASRPRPWLDTLISLVPLLGWGWYAASRGVAPAVIGQWSGTRKSVLRLADPRTRRLVTLTSIHDPAVCAAALQEVTADWWSPWQRLASVSRKPLLGRVRSDRFSVRRRRALTRGFDIVQAAGRIEPASGGSVVSVTIGITTAARGWLLASLLITASWLAIWAVASAGTSRGVGLTIGISMLAVFVLVGVVLLWAVRDDDEYIEAVIRAALAP